MEGYMNRRERSTDMSHRTKPTVLLIEADTSLRRLIALGLQYRGMHIIEASSPANLAMLEGQQPNLLVLDVDKRGSSDWSLLTATQSHLHLSTVPVVVLAWECLSPVHAGNEHHGSQPAEVTCLSKPFDARTLHTMIEQLLLVSTMPRVQTTTPAPTIWPLVTAAGLLLAFIGLMGQLLITMLGLLIVIVALLCWTLGTQTERTPTVRVGKTCPMGR